MPVDPHAHLQIRLIDAVEQFAAQLSGNGFNLFDQRTGRSTEDDFFRPAVFQHGDPGVQNLIVGPDGRVSFIDWENAEDRGAPFWDLLVFLRAYAVWSSRRRRLRSRLGAAVEHFVDGSTLSPFILDAMAEYRRAVAVPSEAVEPLFFMAWVYQAVNEAPRLQRDRLADGQFVRFLDALVQRRDAPLLRRLLGAVEA